MLEFLESLGDFRLLRLHLFRLRKNTYCMVLYKPIRNTVHIMKIANTMVIIVPTVVLFLNISRESEVRSNVLNPVNSKSLTFSFLEAC